MAIQNNYVKNPNKNNCLEKTHTREQCFVVDEFQQNPFNINNLHGLYLDNVLIRNFQSRDRKCLTAQIKV